jgi:integrase/recombinase XerD
MNFTTATDLYIAEQRAEGRFGGTRTDNAYRRTIELHTCDAADAGHGDVLTADRQDVLNTMGRWENSSTKRVRRAQLVSFYDWAVRNQVRLDNPARQTRGPKQIANQPTYPTVEEVQRLLAVARQWGGQEWWAIEMLAGTGIRNAELRALRVRDLSREKFVHVPIAAGKGRRERMIPAVESVQAVAREALATRDPNDYVLGHRQTLDVGVSNPRMLIEPTRPMSGQALMRLLRKASLEAGLGRAITPHALRHYVGWRATKHGSIYLAQAWLGHADIGTTVAHHVGIATDEETVQIRTAMSNDLGWAEQP